MQYSGFKSRELRRQVHLPAAVRLGPSVTEAVVLDWSSYGMKLSCLQPPNRGDYIEIRVGELMWVGRVVWRAAARFGVRTREEVFLAGAAERSGGTRPERERAALRIASPYLLLSAADVGRLFQGLAIMLAVMSAAVGVAMVGYEALASTSSAARMAMQASLDRSR